MHFWVVMATKRLSKDEIEDVKERAKIYYLHENVTNQKDLAKRVKVSENTISKWVNDGNWAKLKKNLLLTREERMSDMLDELTEIQTAIKKQDAGERFANHKTALVRRMLVNDIKALEVKASIPETVAAIMELVKFSRPENADESKIIMKWGDIYIKTLLR